MDNPFIFESHTIDENEFPYESHVKVIAYDFSDNILDEPRKRAFSFESIDNEKELYENGSCEYSKYNYITARRIYCWENTVRICENRTHPPISEKIVYRGADCKMASKKYDHSTIHIYNKDTIDCAMEHIHLNPLVLNMSDGIYAGGWVNSDSSAQDESLFRRTNYHQSLVTSFYPIAKNEAIYSPEISILKMNEETDWMLIPDEELMKLDFIACPAVKYPTTIMINGEDRLSEEDVLILKEKIYLIIQVALDKGHDTIIFGAMGCGCWNNPTKHVAEIFKELLENDCDGVILNYYFAIKTTNDDIDIFNVSCNDNTFAIFSNIFPELN